MHCKRIEPLHRLSISLLSALVTAAITLSALPAAAVDAKAEKDVKELQRKAIEEDNLATDYDAAIKKLQWALTRCAADKCSPALKGSVYRDLGAMQLLNKKAEEGKASFVEALKLDPALNLDPSYKSPALQTVWDDVSKKATAQKPEPAATSKPEPATPPPAAESQSTELTHTPVAEQLKHAPVPVYVEYAGEGLAKATVKYRSGSSGEFKAVDLSKMGKGWGGLVPCDATTGTELQYYVVGRNGSNESLATAGSKKQPFTVALKAELLGEAPHLPGRDAPPVCGGESTEPAAQPGADCPPGLPGCESKKAEGEECDGDSECKSDACTSGKCAAGSPTGKSEGAECDTDNECSSNSCVANKCGGAAKFKRVWLGVSFALDDNLVSSSTIDVCSSQQYVCLQSDNKTPFQSSQLPTGSGIPTVHGNSAMGSVRIMGTFDYAITPNFLLGTRLGYVTGTYQGDTHVSRAFGSAPLHAEVRASYLLGKGVAGTGLTPMFVLGGGISQFGSDIQIKIPNAGSASPVNAWFVSGGGFLSGGGGLRYAVTESIALMGLVRAGAAIGGNSGSFFFWDPELGVQVGF